jgi:hypothetical protein
MEHQRRRPQDRQRDEEQNGRDVKEAALQAGSVYQEAEVRDISGSRTSRRHSSVLT